MKGGGGGDFGMCGVRESRGGGEILDVWDGGGGGGGGRGGSEGT